MAGFLSEEDLAKIKACVLLHKRRELVENVDPRNHLTYLRSKLILDERDCDEIKSARSRQGSAEIFLDILARKGPAGYDEFCKSLLYDETQLFLHTSLTQALSLLRAKVLEDKGNVHCMALGRAQPTTCAIAGDVVVSSPRLGLGEVSP